MGSWLGYSWRRVSTILYYENVCHIATAALQPCRPHTDCRMCWYCSSNCTPCTTDCSTADGKLVQDGATEPNWATVNISSLHFYISTHRLLMLLSRLTMSLHPVLSVRHQPLSMLSPDWKLGFRFPLPAKHLAITSGFCHGWWQTAVVLVTAVWCRGTVNSKSKDWKIKMRPVIAPLLLFRMLDGAVCRNCNNFTNGDTRTSTFLSVYSG